MEMHSALSGELGAGVEGRDAISLSGGLERAVGITSVAGGTMASR